MSEFITRRMQEHAREQGTHSSQELEPVAGMQTLSDIWNKSGIIGAVRQAVTAPGRALRGDQPFNVEEEAFNFATTFSGSGLLSSRVVPPPVGSLGMMISKGGVRSLVEHGITDAHDNFASAIALKASNKTPQEIFQQTGWYHNDTTQAWMYQLPHWKAKINKVRLQELFEKSVVNKQDVVEFSLPEIYDYPELFAAYPALKNLTVKWRGGEDEGAAHILHDLITVEADNLSGLKSVIDHEVQHFVQSYENLPNGSTPLKMTDEDGVRLNLKEQIDQIAKDRADTSTNLGILDFARSLAPNDKRDRVGAIRSFLNRKLGGKASEEEVDVAYEALSLDDTRRLLRAFSYSNSRLESEYLTQRAKASILEETTNLYRKAGGLESDEAIDSLFYESYANTHGEVEARLAQYDTMMAKIDRAYVEGTNPGQRTQDMLGLERREGSDTQALVDLAQRTAAQRAHEYTNMLERQRENEALLLEASRALIRNRRAASANPKP